MKGTLHKNIMADRNLERWVSRMDVGLRIHQLLLSQRGQKLEPSVLEGPDGMGPALRIQEYRIDQASGESPDAA